MVKGFCVLNISVLILVLLPFLHTSGVGGGGGWVQATVQDGTTTQGDLIPKPQDAVMVEAKTGGDDNGEGDEAPPPPSNIFSNFIVPMIKHRLITTGNKTDVEAQNIVEVIISRMNISDDSTATTGSASSDDPFSSGSFFQDFITPMIRQGMMISGNKTKQEAEALINIISQAVESKSKSKSPTITEKNTLTSLNSSRDTKSAISTSSVTFFNDFISPIIRIGMVTSGNKTEKEADSILDTISAMTSAKSGNTAPFIPSFESSEFFKNFISPMIKYDMMQIKNKTETEANVIMEIISSGIANRSVFEPEDIDPLDEQKDAEKPASFFQEFVAPLIRNTMISSQNKTAEEADAILSIITASMKQSEYTNSTLIPAWNSSSFFSKYIAPLIKLGMMNSGNKTETEASGIIDKITSSIKNRTATFPFPSAVFPFFGQKVNRSSGLFFENYICPIVRYHMITTGNKTNSEANAILDIITASISEREEAETAEEDTTDDEKVDEDEDVTILIDEVSEGNAKRNISFFEEFVLPIIRYSIIKNGNKTAQEANAILNIISPTFSETPNNESTSMSGNFFEDFIAPIIRNRLMGEGVRNTSEVDAIINDIVILEREEEAAKTTTESETSGEDIEEDVSGNVTQTFIDGLLIPEMEKTIEDVSKTAVETESKSSVDKSDVAEASGKVIKDITEDFLEVIDNQQSSIELKNDDSSVESASSKTSQDSDDSASSASSQSSEDSASSASSQSSEDSASSASSQSSEDSASSASSQSSEDSISSASSQDSDSASTKSSQDSKDSSSWEKSKNSWEHFKYDKDNSSPETSKDSEDSSSSSKSYKSSASSEESEETSKVTPNTAVVEEFLKDYLSPVLDRKIKQLDTIATFFLNPTVIEELRKALKEVIAMTDSETGQIAINPRGYGADIEEEGDMSSNQLDPINWFVDQLVVPELQQNAKSLDNLVQRVSLLKNNKNIPNAVNKFISNRLKEGSKYFGDGESTTSSESIDSDQIMRDILIPRLKRAIQKFKNITSSVSSEKGQNVITSQVKAFLGRALPTQLKSLASKKLEMVAKSSKNPKLMSSPADSQKSRDNSFDELAGEIVTAAIKKSGERLKVLADKMSRPAVSKSIMNVLKNRINSVVREVEDCTDESCSENVATSGQPAIASSGTQNAEAIIIKQIVELKIQISFDRRKCDEIEREIGKGSWGADDNLKLVLQKLKFVQDIKNCSFNIRNLFIRLRTDTYSTVKTPEAHGDFESSSGNNQNPYVVLQNDISQISQAKDKLADYRRKVNEMNEKLRGHYYIPNRIEIVQEKMKMVWALKSEGIKLDHLYEKAGMDHAAVAAWEEKERAQLEEKPDENFEMDFTDDEKAKYSGLLNELSFAQDPSSGSVGERDSSVATGLLISGLALAAIALSTVGALVVRRRRGRERLYTYIPSEQRIDSSRFHVTKESYGSIK